MFTGIKRLEMLLNPIPEITAFLVQAHITLSYPLIDFSKINRIVGLLPLYNGTMLKSTRPLRPPFFENTVQIHCIKTPSHETLSETISSNYPDS